ncbi:transcription antitermination factor NusB [Pararhizobium mangrovi]|uniref:Transcription antitermination protein NusB n=1 Tax=Pararhizobium mangrovi TaxID=2590452 RepID=A0A506UG00_9HYPH|nr:transcription antitermination factor NusB [Pararhizobium mangrovi]TPW31869.1 transcription antitermination factor NusB [Pararhizobium mangrovi]
MSDRDPKAPRAANQRGAARLAAVQALYQMDVAGTGLNEIVAEYETHRLGGVIDGDEYRPADAAWFRAVTAGVVGHQRELDPEIASALTTGWALSRLDTTLLAILRAGAFEITYRDDVPPVVVVSEYVDVAHAFFEDEEPKLVNAVLDRLARRRQSSDKAGT